MSSLYVSMSVAYYYVLALANVANASFLIPFNARTESPVTSIARLTPPANPVLPELYIELIRYYPISENSASVYFDSTVSTYIGDSFLAICD